MVNRVPLTIAVWLFAAVSCALFVAETMLGPTLFVIDDRHGVHLGDVLACIGFPTWAYAITRSFWLPARGRATTRGRP
jgi:hypothetical protein